MAREVVGELVNTVGFEVDTPSWNNIRKFQDKIAEIKKQMKGLTGNIKIKVSDTNAAVKTAKQVTQKTESTRQKLVKKGLSEEEKMRRKIEDAHNQQQIMHMRRRIREEAREKAKMDKDLASRQGAISTRKVKAVGFTGGLRKLDAGQIKNYHKQVSELDKTLLAGAFSLSQYQANVSNVNKHFSRMNNETRSLNSGFKELRHSIVAGGIAFAAFQGAMSFERTGQEFDSIESTMFGATGTTEKMRKEMEFLSEITQKWGVNTLQAGKGYAKMLASTQGTAVAEEDAKAMFVALTKASAGFGMDAQSTGRAVNAMVQIISKGQVMAEELEYRLAV